MSKKKGRNGSDNHTIDDNTMRVMLMGALYDLGVTAEDYADFIHRIGDMSNDLFEDDKGGNDGFRLMTMGKKGELVHADIKPLDDADKKTLRLKVQMKNINKPPMWRELDVPADYNFLQLHYAIQAVTGLENEHLWQFQRTAYNPDLQIGMSNKSMELGFDIERNTHEANATPITAFLAKKDDKLEYVYDFGDDWIFTVKVLEVLDRQGDVPECKKWKSDLQPIENSGGIWRYGILREAMDSWDTMKPKEKRNIADEYGGYSNPENFYNMLEENKIDIEFVNEQLSEISDVWEDD